MRKHKKNIKKIKINFNSIDNQWNMIIKKIIIAEGVAYMKRIIYLCVGLAIKQLIKTKIMIQIFQYKSTGVKHKEENQFFEFIVKSRFNEQNNRSLQWCRFDGLKIIVETLEPSIVDFVKLTLKNVIETSNGHKWELV